MEDDKTKSIDKDRFISIRISDDRMEVYLTLAPFARYGIDIRLDDILQILGSKGVSFGIKKDIIGSILDKVIHEDTSVKDILIAEGKRPVAGRSHEVEFDIEKAIKDPEKVDALLGQKHEVYAYEVAAIVGKEKEICYKDSVIAVRRPQIPGVNGIDISGHRAEASILPPSHEYKFGKNIKYNEQENNYIAVRDGLLVLNKDVYEIFPININGRVEVAVSNDKMQARVNLFPPDAKGLALKTEDVMKALNLMKIRYGVNVDIISNVVKEVNETSKIVSGVIVAEGLPAINGTDGRINFLVDVDKKITPKVRPDGSVDFYDVSAIVGVQKDQPLAGLIPATPGKPGKNIFDEVINPLTGKACELPAGDNTKISAKDKGILLSAIDGNVRYDGRVISVKPGYEVDGDVDFGVGNIFYKGSVKIKGDVKSGFRLDITDGVEIGGTVEDAIVKSEGKVLIRGGFVGTGKGEIDTRGDVAIRFARNQTIIANNVTILNEAINCTIYAKNDVVVKGGRLSIVGGHTTAGVKIEVNVLGNEEEVHTEVEVGTDYTRRRGLINVRKEISNLLTILEKVDPDVKRLDEIKGKGLGLSTKQMETLDSLSIHKQDIEERLKNLRDKEALLTKGLNINKDAKVIVNNIVYPGVKVRIGGSTINVIEKYRRKTFSLSGEKINMV